MAKMLTITEYVEKNSANFRGTTLTSNMNKFISRAVGSKPSMLSALARSAGVADAAGNAWVRKGLRDPIIRRNIIAHEAFHAGPQAAWYRSIPGIEPAERLVRSNESAARFVGGFRAPRNAGVGKRLVGGVDELVQYLIPSTSRRTAKQLYKET